MRPDLVVIHEPGVGFFTDMRKSPEALHVEELIADAAIEGFNPSILRGLARVDEVQQDVVIDL